MLQPESTSIRDVHVVSSSRVGPLLFTHHLDSAVALLMHILGAVFPVEVLPSLQQLVVVSPGRDDVLRHGPRLVLEALWDA